MGKKERLKEARACDRCGVLASVQYRINVGDGWLIVCKSCQSNAKHHQNYVYGGTWKQKKRN
jgi:transcription elongation factor Elf1